MVNIKKRVKIELSYIPQVIIDLLVKANMHFDEDPRNDDPKEKPNNDTARIRR